MTVKLLCRTLVSDWIDYQTVDTFLGTGFVASLIRPIKVLFIAMPVHPCILLNDV